MVDGKGIHYWKWIGLWPSHTCTDYSIMNARTFTYLEQVENFLLADSKNRVRDKDGDIIRAYKSPDKTHYILVNGEELLDLRVKNYGPWTEILNHEHDTEIDEEEDNPRFQEPGPEDLHYEIKSSQERNRLQQEAYSKLTANEPVQFGTMEAMAVWLINNPGREVEDRNQLRFYFGANDDNKFTFRYGNGASIQIENNRGPWKVVPKQESDLRAYATELIEMLDISPSNQDSITAFLKKVIANH